MNLSEEEIRAIVSLGAFSDKEAEEYLVRTLLLRQKKIGELYLDWGGGLDNFRVEDGDRLVFDDLLQKAATCIEKLEFEQAIGIIEGLIEMFPANAIALREKIGDCRMLQQDYKSARWNYDQAFKLNPRDFGIRMKIKSAQQMMEKLPVSFSRIC